jgi:hypothetical protein
MNNNKKFTSCYLSENEKFIFLTWMFHCLGLKPKCKRLLYRMSFCCLVRNQQTKILKNNHLLIFFYILLKLNTNAYNHGYKLQDLWRLTTMCHNSTFSNYSNTFITWFSILTKFQLFWIIHFYQISLHPFFFMIYNISKFAFVIK